MADENNDHKLDRVLNELLSQYSAVEPRPGLETKVLARLRESAHAHTRWWMSRWLWAGAATATTAAIILFALFSTRQAPRPPAIATAPPRQKAPQFQHPHVAEPGPTRLAAARPAPRRRPHRSSVANMSVARKEVFPSPEPLSQQDMLLLRYLAATPHEELVAQSRPDPPQQDREP